MNAVRVTPGVAGGDVTAPPSKSYTHRALVVGHLSRRTFRIIDPLDADDTRATARGLTALGTPVSRARRIWTVRPLRSARRSAPRRVDCGESGTTFRFLTAVAALSPKRTTFRGRGRLLQRPMEGLVTALRSLGAQCTIGGTPDSLTVRGPIHAGKLRLDASTTSQFTSALLLALPVLPDRSEIQLTGPIVSRPYLEATLALLARQGVEVRREGRRLIVPGGQRYRGRSFRPPGDASSAAYLWTSAAVTGGKVRVRGLNDELPQADTRILELLERSGATVLRHSESVTVQGRARDPFEIELTDAPDLYPLAGVLATTIPGRSEIRGAPHVALKESDRRSETARLVRAFGGQVRPTRGGLRIEGTATPRGVRLTDLADHRLAMSAAVGALAATGPSWIGPEGSVNKSFPDFWSVLRRLTEGSSV